jgi:outer membrane protein W
MDIAINSVRVGYMFNDPTFSRRARGNVQVLAEVFGGRFSTVPGDMVAGATLFLRYNFIQPNARIVPYLQGGAGLVYSDFAHGAEGGNAVSLDVNFNLQASAGLRFNVNSKWSILVEGGYRHISNASLSDPNYGIDQVGGSAGFAFSF